MNTLPRMLTIIILLAGIMNTYLAFALRDSRANFNALVADEYQCHKNLDDVVANFQAMWNLSSAALVPHGLQLPADVPSQTIAQLPVCPVNGAYPEHGLPEMCCRDPNNPKHAQCSAP